MIVATVAAWWRPIGGAGAVIGSPIRQVAPRTDTDTYTNNIVARFNSVTVVARRSTADSRSLQYADN